jgi:hypothetical protein
MAVAEIARSLYGTLFRDSTSVSACCWNSFLDSIVPLFDCFWQGQHSLAREDLRTLLVYMTTYFPFRPNTITNRDMKVCPIVLGCGSIDKHFF